MPNAKKLTKSKKRTKKPIETKISLPRAPVVAVLGHVDHGKTSLLDNIRKTRVQAQETGGITQHIGAYQVIHKNQPITFIDTPGHAAFAKMRHHGAQVTDLVVLVVAANDGVKPQTKESIRHIKEAGVPLIVAINKMDLPGASADMVKAQLVENDISVEGYGGDVVAVETIATKGKGISELLEMILLVAQLQKIKSNPTGSLKAIVIESKMQKSRGPIASAIVKNGTLAIGDHIQAGSVSGTVRALYDEHGKQLREVKPGDPVEILGFKDLPLVGEIVTRVGEETPKSKKPTTTSQPKKSEAEKPKDQKDPTDEDQADLSAEASAKEEDQEEEDEAEKPRIKAVIKADTQGTLDAIITNVAEEVEQIGEGVGEVSESDIMLAQATGAKILSFRVKTSKSAQKLAELEGVEIKQYQAIYELLEDLEKQVLKILEPTIDEEEIGVAKIAAEFEIRKSRIAGCKVLSGKMETGGSVHLMRGDKIVADAKIRSLKQAKKDISVAKKGEACGIILKPQLDFKVGDNLHYYRVVGQ